MKKNILKTLFIIIAFTFLASCDNETEITKLSVISFPQTFTASNNSVVISSANDETLAVRFSWEEVNYGIKATVTYTLQFDVPKDTIGATPWSKAFEVVAGEGILTKEFTANEINAIAINALGMEPGEVSKMVVRVKSFVDRPAFSNSISIDVNPFLPPIVIPDVPTLWVFGDYQNWSPTTAATIVSNNSDGLYEGYVYIPAGGTNQIKYANQPDLNHIVYGDGGAGNLSTEATAGNITLPSDGYYELSANLNTMKWTATKTTWAIIGGATPGGWDTETPLTYNPTTKVWTVSCDLKADGNTFKFRANNAWKISMSVDGNGKLVYVDNPLYPYNPQPDIPVTTAGNYTITLDLHIPGQYSFKMKMN